MKKKYILPSIANIELAAEVILASDDYIADAAANFDDEVDEAKPETEDFGFIEENDPNW